MSALKPLTDDQADGAQPADSAWVSASAGTGKTQVLAARVLRLLLEGASPERILCLTYTKAAAAEMQSRIFARLADWVTIDDAALRADLAAIRSPADPPTCAAARRLFARTLEARGGLNIQTLHGFAQSLLASFPLEAGIAPGFTALDDRSALGARSRVLADAIDAAAAAGDAGFEADIAAISVAGGEARLANVTTTLLANADAVAALGNPAGFEAQLRRLLEVPVGGSVAEIVAAAVARLDQPGLRRLANVWLASGTATYVDRADALLGWLGCSPAMQVEQLPMLQRVFYGVGGERFKSLMPGGSKANPAQVLLAEQLADAVGAVGGLAARLATAAHAARYLRVGARIGGAYALYKHRAGVIDYGDMIARAAALLTQPGLGEWVRFKLDSRIDHLLIDEAQDTNVDQWTIIEALTDEFFDGAGARDVRRTLFVVGDFKQAIFSFQGSDPRVFGDRREHFAGRVADAQLGWADVPLSQSFRSVRAVLEVVDAVVATLTPAAFGRPDAIPPHHAARGDLPGAVTLWPPLAPDVADADESDDGEEVAWLPKAQVRMANKLADQIAAWLAPSTPLWLPARGRAVRPEDILVLVRSRGEFVGALVGALHDRGVPVAGVDRLRLTAPLAVQDCLALIRFVLQPNDDLACATLLTSPFIGLDHDTLFALAHGRPGRLWPAVRAAGGPAADWLRAALALADYSAPYEFLETVLSGPLGGRARLLARLGSEARAAIDALLAQALVFEVANAPSLQGFLAWIEADDVDLKRDPDAPVDAVRILTVHAAKGLQAPVVVLADATAPPAAEQGGHVLMELGDGDVHVPIFHGGKPGQVGRIEAAVAAAAADRRAEHWRLLYVALTRAEDLLFVGGALAKPRGDGPAKLPEASWYAVIEAAVQATDPQALEPDAVWGEVRRYRAGSAVPAPTATSATAAQTPTRLPAWATTAAREEARPPRPLSPSAIAADDIVNVPPSPAGQLAARRGQLLHALFERLPVVPAAARAERGATWLARNAADLDDAARGGLLATVLGIVDDPRFANLFGPDALAEAPIAAVVGTAVIAGKVDRLLVLPDRVRLIDFKTGRAVPASAAEVPVYYLRQMAAYVAALRVIFGDRPIEATLLFTATATPIELPPALLAAHAPG
ncbi:double-strand break repair helicase AddA [Sphingomonas sp.]|uniref:double-strand break repair helicase AddA n=1 Tax=Sphingomonas sp. TaxID=28214 RepID=UPI003CC567DD